MRYVTHSELIASNLTHYVLDGLRPGARYVIRLAAVNQAGRGPFTPSQPPVTTLPAGNAPFHEQYRFASRQLDLFGW